MKRPAFILTSILFLAFAPGLAHAKGAEGTAEAKQKATTLTGCLSTSDQEGGYTLKTKNRDIEIRGSEQLRDHVGHEVKLTGTWMEGRAHTGQAPADSKEAARTDKPAGRHFMVDNIQHIAETCKTQSSR